MDLVQPDFAISYVATGEAEVAHPLEGELAKVAVLDTGRDEGHGDIPASKEISVGAHSDEMEDAVPLYSVDSSPRRNEGEIGRAHV